MLNISRSLSRVLPKLSTWFMTNSLGSLNTRRLCSHEVLSNVIQTKLSPNGVLAIKMNRPHRKNALTWAMFTELARQINEANSRSEIKITTLTGEADFFSSGVDIGNFSQIPTMSESEQKDFAEVNKNVVYDAFNAVIEHSKPFIVLANGPGVGFGATILGLSDVAYASDKAYFLTPFVTLGMNPEGCSSYTFPSVMGHLNANRMLMLGEKIPATEAQRLGLLTHVFDYEQFQIEASKRVEFICEKLIHSSLMKTKSLVFDEEKKRELKKRNRLECDLLGESFKSQHFKLQMSKMFAAKS